MLPILLVVITLMFSPMNTPVVPVGSGSYTTELPPNQAAPQEMIYRSADLNRPMPTNQWWSALAWQLSGNRAMFAHPLALAAYPDGLAVSYPNVPFVATNGGEYRYRFFEDFRVGVDGLERGSAAPVVAGFSDWTVTAAWENDALRATMGHGLPFVYFTTAGGEAVITFRQPPEIRSNEDGSIHLTVRERSYGIYAPSGSTWQIEGTQLRSTLAGKTYFSVAVLPDSSAETFVDFRAHAFAFVIGTRVEWAYDESGALVTTTFDVATQPMEGDEQRPLLALYRHQWLHSADVNTDYSYVSPRGEMRVVRESRFQTTMTFPGILPFLPDAGVSGEDVILRDINRMERFSDDLRLNLPGPGGERDTYWTGKGLNRVVQLVSIAEQAGDLEARDAFLETLRRRLEDWLSVTSPESLPHFYYDSNWGTLIGYPAANFGYDRFLNDHHFHHGYFIMAAATIARYDPEWAAESRWGGMINLLIRDANSPDRDDPLFPRLRSFDVYAGHSWASGANEGDHGANQESSSEAMNFAAAVILWGEATGNHALRDFGIYLYTTEMTAIEQYWFDVDQAVFPEGYRHPAVGIVWSDGGVYTTWWTTDPVAVHAINFLPITPASLYLGRHPDYIAHNYTHLTQQIGGSPAAYSDVVLGAYALADAAEALDIYRSQTVTPELGETQAHLLHWLLTLNALGQVDRTVTADTPFYAVFNRGGERTYTAYHSGGEPRLVKFSDGTTLRVSPGELAVTSGD